MARNVGWLRSALTDEHGAYDVAYVSLFGVMFATVGPILVMTVMSVVSHLRCSPHELIHNDVVTVIECKYDPQPLGIAIGAACGGFSAALAALAAYMLATRRQQPQIIQPLPPPPPPTTQPATITTTTTAVQSTTTEPK